MHIGSQLTSVAPFVEAVTKVGPFAADLKARYDLAQAVTAKVTEANKAVLQVRGLRAQAEALGTSKQLARGP